MDPEDTLVTAATPAAVSPKGEWENQVLADGRFLILDLLATGGMADVYRGWDNEAKCDVAVKVPKPMLLNDPQFAGRFEREIKLSARLRHAHIVPVLDCGFHRRQPYAVFAYLAGGSLKDRLVRKGPPIGTPPVEAVRWLAQIASALDFLHAKGLLHRDVKPDNIFFDPRGKAHLGDFGIARAMNPNPSEGDATALTDPNVVLGTFAYIAPELIMGKLPYTGAIDQYSLAVTMYEVLSGRTPFTGTPQEVMIHHTQTMPTPLNVLRPDIPRAVSEAVQRAMAKDPTDRFPDCAALSREVLDGLQTPLPALPEPFSDPPSLQAMSSSNDSGRRWLWWTAMAAALAAGVAVGAIGVTMWK